MTLLGEDCNGPHNINPMERKIRVGITHGDINGISYEVILKILADEKLVDLCTPVFFGSGKVAGFYRKMLNLEEVRFHVINDASQAKDGCVNIVNISQDELKIEPGVATEESGKAASIALDRAMEAILDGSIDVLVTAPINKAAMKLAGFGYVGHTEYLEAKAGEGHRSIMTFVDDRLRVALLTTHLPMTEVPASVTTEAILSKLREMDKSLRRDFGCSRPLVAVLALNPHASDEGLIGSEEKDAIAPAIEAANKEGIMAFGPYSADSFFGSDKWSRFDAVLAMYHDQGLVGFKALSGNEGVNCTCGLPFVRTSPDHGTGYDIVGKNEADPTSMRHAIYTAIDIFRAREEYDEAHANPLKPMEKSDRRSGHKQQRLIEQAEVDKVNATISLEESIKQNESQE